MVVPELLQCLPLQHRDVGVSPAFTVSHVDGQYVISNECEYKCSAVLVIAHPQTMVMYLCVIVVKPSDNKEISPDISISVGMSAAN